MVLQTPYGGMGMGATHPDYLHKGYNSVAHALILNAMSKSEFQIHGHVMVDNEIALNFFLKNGVKIVGKTYRVDIVPGDYKYTYFKSNKLWGCFDLSLKTGERILWLSQLFSANITQVLSKMSSN